MNEPEVKVVEEGADHILVQVEALSESAAIEQAENWAKMEGVEYSDVTRVSGKNTQKTTGGSRGASPGGVLGLYYYLHIVLVPGVYPPKDAQINKVTQ